MDHAVRHVMMRQGVLGVTVSIMLPHDPTVSTAVFRLRVHPYIAGIDYSSAFCECSNQPACFLRSCSRAPAQPNHSPCVGDSFLIVDAFSTCVVPFEWSPLSAGQGGAQDPPVGRDHHPPAQGGNSSGGHAQLWLKLSASLFCRGGQAWPNQGRDRRALICRD